MGISNAGEILGNYSDNYGAHGFVYNNGTFTTFDIPGTLHLTPYGINNRGMIVGFYMDSNNRNHGFLARRIPEPSFLFLLGSGIVLLAGLGRK